jgi:hypothetical protein
MKGKNDMITVSVKNLVEAIREADAFAIPDMKGGVDYLYNSVFCRMSKGHDVKLSELDFDAFEPEDIDSFSDIYSDVFERNSYAAHNLSSTLRSVAPASKAVAYV